MSENRVTAQQKKAVVERANGCCEYCRSQARLAIQPFSIEHIIPNKSIALILPESDRFFIFTLILI